MTQEPHLSCERDLGSVINRCDRCGSFLTAFYALDDKSRPIESRIAGLAAVTSFDYDARGRLSRISVSDGIDVNVGVPPSPQPTVLLFLPPYSPNLNPILCVQVFS